MDFLTRKVTSSMRSTLLNVSSDGDPALRYISKHTSKSCFSPDDQELHELSSYIQTYIWSSQVWSPFNLHMESGTKTIEVQERSQVAVFSASSLVHVSATSLLTATLPNRNIVPGTNVCMPTLAAVFFILMLFPWQLSAGNSIFSLCFGVGLFDFVSAFQKCATL